MIGPKATNNFFETISGQRRSIVGKALKYVAVKYEWNGDQTTSGMNPYMEMNKLEKKRLKYTWRNYNLPKDMHWGHWRFK